MHRAGRADGAAVTAKRDWETKGAVIERRTAVEN